MKRGEFNAECDGMTRMIICCRLWPRGSDPDIPLCNMVYKRIYKKQLRVASSGQSIFWRIHTTRWPSEDSGRCWNPHACAASVAANRDR
jgi:hypothetical protein